MRWLLRWFSRAAWSEWFHRLVFPHGDPSGRCCPEALQITRLDLIRLSSTLLAAPSKEHQATVERIESLAHLSWLAERMLDVGSWDELLVVR